MTNHRSFIVLAAALTSVAPAVAAQSQEPGLGNLRAIVSRQSAADLFADGLCACAPESGAIALAKVETMAPGVDLFRATVWTVDHGRPYLIASVSGSPVALGGFASPDLSRLSAALGPVTAASAPLRARVLSTAADPNGATDLLDRSDPSHADSLWRRLPAHWPSDTVAVAGALLMVRLTVLSRRAWTGYGHAWEPIRYTYVFGKSGELLSWTRVMGLLFTDAQ